MSPRVTHAEPIGGTRLRLTFTSGETGIVDIAALTKLTGVFEPLRDPDYFARVRVDADACTISWPSGADICPDVLYLTAMGRPIPGENQQAA